MIQAALASGPSTLSVILQKSLTPSLGPDISHPPEGALQQGTGTLRQDEECGFWILEDLVVT